MRFRFAVPRAWAIAATGAGLALLGGALAVGPVVRAAVRAESARHHVHVTIGSVRPAWYGVVLTDVDATPDGVAGVDLRLNRVFVDLTWLFQVHALEASGGLLLLAGDETSLRTDLETWHGGSPSAASARRSPSSLRWSVSDMSIRWTADAGSDPRWVADGVAVHSSATGTEFHVGGSQVRFGAWSLSVAGVDAELGAGAALRGGHCETAIVSWQATADDPRSLATGDEPRPRGTGDEPRLLAHDVVSPKSTPVALAAAPAGPRVSKPKRLETGNPVAAVAPDERWASTPVDLPDLGLLRAKVDLLRGVLSERIPDGAHFDVGALTWKVSLPAPALAPARRDAAPPPLTLGPGPLSIARSPAGIEVRFSADPALAPTPLAVHALLPTDGSDPAISLDGGPVPLPAIGIQEGAAGLVDVGRSSLSGRARVVLAGDGSALTFDGELGLHHLSIDEPRLAADIVRDLDLEVRARGAATASHQLRLDDLGASVGALRLDAAGTLDQAPDHWSGSIHFESPEASCQALMDSLPPALLPDLEGTRIVGTFEAHGRLAFDSRDLDSLDLAYDTADRCKLANVPSWLLHERFEHSFVHRIYLPDGTIGEQTTGPGTTNWTPLDDISPYMEVAVLTTEDGAFPKHHGFNRAAIRASLIANLKARRFVRGASTITMQLAKNLFLTRGKTLSRKLEEVVLTEYLEQTFSKDEILELYLNVIEFGPAVYGITAAADYYFGRTPAELNLAECLFLSSLLPSPRRYAAVREAGTLSDGFLRTIHTLMNVAHKNGRIGDAELAEGEIENVVFWTGGERPPPRPAVQARPRLDGEDVEDVTLPPDGP
jgi:hypothetical protein